MTHGFLQSRKRCILPAHDDVPDASRPWCRRVYLVLEIVEDQKTKISCDLYNHYKSYHHHNHQNHHHYYHHQEYVAIRLTYTNYKWVTFFFQHCKVGVFIESVLVDLLMIWHYFQRRNHTFGIPYSHLIRFNPSTWILNTSRNPVECGRTIWKTHPTREKYQVSCGNL